MNQAGQKVAIITGGSQGIGASLVAACRRQGWILLADPGEILHIDGGQMAGH